MCASCETTLFSTSFLDPWKQASLLNTTSAGPHAASPRQPDYTRTAFLHNCFPLSPEQKKTTVESDSTAGMYTYSQTDWRLSRKKTCIDLKLSVNLPRQELSEESEESYKSMCVHHITKRTQLLVKQDSVSLESNYLSLNCEFPVTFCLRLSALCVCACVCATCCEKLESKEGFKPI